MAPQIRSVAPFAEPTVANDTRQTVCGATAASAASSSVASVQSDTGRTLRGGQERAL